MRNAVPRLAPCTSSLARARSGTQAPKYSRNKELEYPSTQDIAVPSPCPIKYSSTQAIENAEWGSVLPLPEPVPQPVPDQDSSAQVFEA